MNEPASTTARVRARVNARARGLDWDRWVSAEGERIDMDIWVAIALQAEAPIALCVYQIRSLANGPSQYQERGQRL